jgi:hypothetical protein
MSLIVTRANGITDITFSLQQQKDNQRVYINPGSSVTEPETLVLQSFPRPTGAKGTDRYKMIAQKAYVEDTTGNTIYVSASLEIKIPRTTEAGVATAVADCVAFLKSLTPASMTTALMVGVLPPDGGDYHVDTFNPA